jgi:hypothetical protein
MFRVHFSAGDLIIDQRIMFAGADLLRLLDSEDEIRRLLIDGLACDSSALGRLRNFWASGSGDGSRINVAVDRLLVDRLARAAAGGHLAAFAVRNRPLVHETQVQAKVEGYRPIGRATETGSSAPRAARPPTPVMGPRPGRPDEPAFDVRSLDTHQRLIELINRAAAGRGEFVKLLDKPVLASLVGTLGVWSDWLDLGIGPMIDALQFATDTTGAGNRYVDWPKKLHEALGDVSRAREVADLDAAAKKFAEVVEALGVGTFIVAMQRGARRVLSRERRGKSAPAAPVVTRPPVQRVLERPESARPAAGPSGPVFPAPAAQAQALRQASKSGVPFCEICQPT